MKETNYALFMGTFLRWALVEDGKEDSAVAKAPVFLLAKDGYEALKIIFPGDTVEAYDIEAGSSQVDFKIDFLIRKRKL